MLNLILTLAILTSSTRISADFPSVPRGGCSSVTVAVDGVVAGKPPFLDIEGNAGGTFLVRATRKDQVTVERCAARDTSYERETITLVFTLE